MKVLMLSTDEKVFESGSPVRERMISYGTMVDELHIVVYTKRESRIQNLEFRIGRNVLIYSTNSACKFCYFLDAYKIAKKVILDSNFYFLDSIITTQDPFETGLLGYLLKKKFGLPLQIQIHTDFLSPYFWRESVKNKIRVLLAKRLIKKADGLRVVSDRIKKSLHDSRFMIPDSRIAVLPIFFDKARFEQAAARKEYNDDFLILTVARLEPEKNLFLALEAVAEVLREYPKTRYVIIGSGSLKNQLVDKIKSLDVSDRIEIKQVNTSDLPSWYKRANLFLLTSNYEGYGLAVVEAVASGLPVVMTDVGVAIGSVVPVDKAEPLVAALRKLIESPEERRLAVERQKQFFNNLPTKAEYLNQMLESWQSCCS